MVKFNENIYEQDYLLSIKLFIIYCFSLKGMSSFQIRIAQSSFYVALCQLLLKQFLYNIFRIIYHLTSNVTVLIFKTRESNQQNTSRTLPF